MLFLEIFLLFGCFGGCSPGVSDGKESTCNAGDLGLKITWRRPWQPTPVFLPRESPWTEVPGSMGSQRVGHD